MRRLSSRRSVLRASAVGGAYALAGGPLVGSAAGERTPSGGGAGSGGGKLVFTYDDGPIEDYTKAFPVHREAGVPGCIGAISNRLGHSHEWLDADHVREFEAAGWEVVGHSFRHRALDSIPLTADVAPGDDRIYVRSNVHAREPADILISDGDRSTVATIAEGGEDDRGQFIRLEAPVGESFAADDGVTERYVDDVLETEIVQSKADLEELGFSVSNFIFPYSRHGERSMELIREHYDAVANYRRGGINHVDGLDPYRLSRRYLVEGSGAELAAWMDGVAREGVIGVLGVHARDDALTADRIRTAIRMANERDVDIVTLRRALVDAGVVEPERPAATPTSSRPTGTPTPETPSNGRGTREPEGVNGGLLGTIQRLLGGLIDGLLGLV